MSAVEIDIGCFVPELVRETPPHSVGPIPPQSEVFARRIFSVHVVETLADLAERMRF